MSIYELTTSGSALVAARCAALTLADGRPMLLAVPSCDTTEFLRDVAAEERARLLAIFECFMIMTAARSIKAGAMAAAAMHKFDGRGWSAKTLMDLYRAYKQGGYKPGDYAKTGARYVAGDWRILLRDYTGRQSKLPPEFIRWIGEQWASFRGRSDVTRALWRHVIQDVWLKGQPVPGYGTVEEWCKRTGRARPHPLLVRPGELPEGWSESTFRRLLPKRESSRKQVANGYLAAHTHQPDQVLGDRRQLMPLQYVFLDDTRPDFRCIHFNGIHGEFVYPLLVLGLDAATGVDLANVAKPRALKSPEAEDAAERKARHGVTHDMALMVVLHVIRRFGFPIGYPITFVHENAAACIPSEAKRVLYDAFGDRIQFEATSTFRGRMMQYGFTEAGGAPYDKAPIEVFFRLLMTQLARTPMSTGPRYDTAPSENQAIEKYTLALLKQAGSIESIVERLRLPALDFNQAHAAIEDALRLLRFRTKHALQGFDKVREWRRNASEEFQPFSALCNLSLEEQASVEIIERLECPAERFVRLLQGVQFTQADENILTYLEGQRRPVTVRNGRISMRASEVSTDELIFRDANNPLLDVEAEGRSYEAVLSSDGQSLVLGDREGRILGRVDRQERVSRADTEALHREQGRVRSLRCADRDAFAGYYLGDTNTALAQLRQHNAAVLANAQLEAPQAAQLSAPKASKRQMDAIEILIKRDEQETDSEA